MSSGNCIRHFFGGQRKATDEIKVGYGSTEYKLLLCDPCAKAFDDAMWGWLRGAEEVIDDNFAGDITLSDLSREAPRVAPERARKGPEPKRKPAVLARSELDLLRLRFPLTDHAVERLAERGPIFGFGIGDVLRCAAEPQRAHPDRDPQYSGTDVWVHLRDGVKVVIDRKVNVILTVGGVAAEDRVAV